MFPSIPVAFSISCAFQIFQAPFPHYVPYIVYLLGYYVPYIVFVRGITNKNAIMNQTPERLLVIKKK